MAGFKPDQIAAMDHKAMEGFRADQMEQTIPLIKKLK